MFDDKEVLPVHHHDEDVMFLLHQFRRIRNAKGVKVAREAFEKYDKAYIDMLKAGRTDEQARQGCNLRLERYADRLLIKAHSDDS